MNEFLDLMDKYILLLNDIIDTSNKKFDAIAANDIDGLNKCISEDEASTLKFKGFDLKREKLCEEHNVKTFDEYIEKLTGEEKERGLKIRNALRERADILRTINETNERCIKLNLMQIEKIIQMLGGKSKKVYERDGSAEKTEQVSKFKSQKI